MVNVMTNDKRIFECFKKEDNDQLSSLKGLDLRDFLFYLESYYLELRNVINLDMNDTFGIEIEFEHSNNTNIEKDIKYNWFLKFEGSLLSGGEVTSSTLFDSQKNWQDLKDICSLIATNSQPGELAGGHIHIGVPVLGCCYDSWLNFIKLWSTYENVLFRYAYNEYLTERPELLKYAPPIAKELWYSSLNESKAACVGADDHFKFYRFFDYLPKKRSQAVNFKNVENVYRSLDKNTIEFRCPNATLNPIIWQNNVNVFTKLLNCCKSNKMDLEKVLYRHNMIEDIQNDLYAYREVYLNQALELSDIIFNNNFDKIYFLKQYLKNFEVGNKTLVLAKKITM